MKSKISQPIRGQDGHLDFPITPKDTTLVEDVEILDLDSCKVSLNFIPHFEEKSKMPQPIRDQGGHLGFSDQPKTKIGRGR